MFNYDCLTTNKEEFRSWANKSRSLAIGSGFAAMSNPAKKEKNISKIVRTIIKQSNLILNPIRK